MARLPGCGTRVRTEEKKKKMQFSGWLASPGAQRAAGVGLGLAADAVLADPSRWHPAVGVGQLASHLEDAMYQPRRTRGGVHLGLVTRAPDGRGSSWPSAGWPARRPGSPCWRAVSWAAIGARSLRREARAARRAARRRRPRPVPAR